MKRYKLDYFRFDLPLIRRVFSPWRLRTKLLLGLIPCVVIILILTGCIATWFSSQFLNVVLEEKIQVQTIALASDFEILLKQCKDDLMIIAQTPIARSEYPGFLATRKNVHGILYKELAYISLKWDDHFFVLAEGNDISIIPAKDAAMIRPSPFIFSDNIKQLKEGEVWISGIMDVLYTSGTENQGNHNEPTKIIRLVTPCFSEDNSLKGLLVLAIDLHHLLTMLPQVNSSLSPLSWSARPHGQRCFYLFDKEGSILFHSEEARSDFKKPYADIGATRIEGDIAGKRDLRFSYRPSFSHKDYWKIVKNVRGGKHGSIETTDLGEYHSQSRDVHLHGYAPICFNISSDRNPIVFGGVVLSERSNITRWAGYKQIDIIFLVTLSTIIVISILIFILSRVITRPIFDLASAVKRIQKTGKLREIYLPTHDVETNGLKNAINKMVVTLRDQMEQISIKDEMLEKEKQREKARLEEEVDALKKRLKSHAIKEIVGVGPAIDALKSDIIKTASVDADILIIGETGTGKQLTAEAIHKHSNRAQKPFISINCGALDENLLSDSLFGHVKGAFSEARGNRKGAFLAADGGTLFLDEIGTASPKVQQSLLRAISLRKIRPLGSDQEIDVNVRLITATNIDLKELIEKGLFREDLYYRLEVLTINTPCLRDHKEDIPVLTDYFLKQAGRVMNKEGVGLSKAALEKIKNYHWPGNVRELMNCITRSMVMVEGELIHSNDISLGGEGKEQLPPVAFPSNRAVGDRGVRPEPISLRKDKEIPPGLNVRQIRAFPSILQKGKITRSEYQEIVGNLPSRTAIYDLRDLVKRGVLKKKGRGPATCYCLAKLHASAR